MFNDSDNAHPEQHKSLRKTTMTKFKNNKLTVAGTAPIRFAIAAASAFLLIGAATQSFAVLTPLPPGTTEIPGVPVTANDFSNTAIIPAGSIVATQTWSNIASNTGLFTFSGKEIVWRETATGNLDFFFQVINSGGSIDSIHRVTVTGFSGLLTDVGFDDTARATGPTAGEPAGNFVGGSQAFPDTADRSPTPGNTIGFDFKSNVIAALDHEIKPGQTSDWFAIKTNGKLPLGPGSLQAIDGGVAFTNILVPVPEPSTVLFGLALGSFVMGSRVRRRKETAS
jgi:hypothetical protein